MTSASSGPAGHWGERPELQRGTKWRGRALRFGKIRRNFGHSLKPFEQAMHFPPLQSEAGLLEYFAWAGFQGDLLLHIIETDESFDRVFRDVMIDLSDPKIVAPPHRADQRYLRMRVRADVFRHVLQRGLPWEELTIGFCARFRRDPDVYNMDFWANVQDKLPERPAWP